MTWLLIALCAGAAAPTPDVFRLEHDGAVADVAVCDVNGDGRGDVIALNAKQSGGDQTVLSVYLGDAKGAYSRKPDCVRRLPASIGGAFFAETDGAAPREIVAVDTAGAHVLAFRNGTLEIVEEPRFVSLFPAAMVEPLFLKRQAVDIDADGIDEWLVPLPHGYALRSPRRQIATIECHVAGSVAHDSGLRTHLRYEFPGVVAFPWESEVHQALAFINTHTVEVARGPRWDDLICSDIPFRNNGGRRSGGRPGPYADTFPKPPKPKAHAELHDLNGDGLPDLVVTEAEGSLNIETRTDVYYAREDCTFGDEPGVSFVKSGAFAQPTVIDVDGDGRKDVFFFELSFGLKSMVSYFVREKITLRLEAHLNSEDGLRSDAQFESKFSLDAPEDQRPGVLALGDFTGDGRMDAAFSLNGERLGVFEGRGRELVSDEPLTEIDIPPFGVAKTCRLDANRREDVVVFEPGREDAPIHVAVF